ncbi:F-box and leucine-rich repeat protein 4 [Dissophora globulifera]|nr:F-box and leucine-rich repeat protein 4 [Dissophora globulifera]
MNDLPSVQVLAIPEILCMIIDCADAPTLKTASLVCKAWRSLTTTSLWRQLVIPKDWYNHDLTSLWPILDRQGSAIRSMSLELSTAARVKREVDAELIRSQLTRLLSRVPNLESLNIQLPRELKSNILSTIGDNAMQIKQFETDILNWEPEDMANLLRACSNLRQISGHNFSGDVLKAIAKTQPTLNKIDCTHPRFDDEELVAFVKQYPDLLRLSVSLHQFLSTKALIEISRYCHNIEYLGFHFCLGLQSAGFQAIFHVSTHLRVLDLGPSEVHDVDIELVAAQCPQLETLKLPFCANITNVGISAIVHSCQHLRHLDLSWCDKVLLSIFDLENLWVCEKLRYLDISGIHASYSVEASMASALLPSMYHQLSLLTQLQHLRLSGHGFSLRLLDLGGPLLKKLTRLELLDIVKLKNPIPWKDMVAVGNLFPRLKEFDFRSSDVIPPHSTTEREYIRSASQGHVRRGPFTDVQPEPGVALGGGGGTEAEDVWRSGQISSSSALKNKPPSKRRRSKSPSPSVMPLTTSVAGIESTQMLSEPGSDSNTDAEHENEADEDEVIDGVMKAKLRSGLIISFQLSGEDEEEGPDVGDGAWGFPAGLPF